MATGNLLIPAASTIVNAPAGGVVATTVQAAVNELDTEKAPKASPDFTGHATHTATTVGNVLTLTKDNQLGGLFIKCETNTAYGFEVGADGNVRCSADVVIAAPIGTIVHADPAMVQIQTDIPGPCVALKPGGVTELPGRGADRAVDIIDASGVIRCHVTGDGRFRFGNSNTKDVNGYPTFDVEFWRSSAGVLSLTGALSMSGGLAIGDFFNVPGSTWHQANSERWLYRGNSGLCVYRAGNSAGDIHVWRDALDNEPMKLSVSSGVGTLTVGNIAGAGAALTNIPQSAVTSLVSNLAAKAPLASPTFTGTVTVPSGAALGTPASLTLTNATGLPQSAVTGLVSSLALKAPLASPTFTGSVELPASNWINSGGGENRIYFSPGGTTFFASGNNNGSSAYTFRNSDASDVFSITGNGNVVIGNAALSTSATDGFLYIPTCAGTPTGAPTAQTGRAAIVFDTSANKLWIRNGATWKFVTLA